VASVLRQTILAVADAPLVQHQVERYGRRLVSRFVAGDTVEDGLRVAEELRAQGLAAILDLLGEGTSTRSQAESAAGQLEAMVRAIAARQGPPGLPVELAVKLSHLGAQEDAGLAMELLRRLLEVAGGQVFLWIDMEGSDLTETTVATFEALRPQYRELGLVLQAYLRRSADDLARVAPLDPVVRVVKGAYLEPPSLAFNHKAEVDRNFSVLVERCFDRGIRVAIATHDADLVHQLISRAGVRGVGKERYEFQTLYGVATELARELAGQGHLTKVYVPVGRDWYRYFSRRLAERPANVAFLLRALLAGRNGRAPFSLPQSSPSTSCPSSCGPQAGSGPQSSPRSLSDDQGRSPTP
jgi:proline dehydrogenase